MPIDWEDSRLDVQYFSFAGAYEQAIVAGQRALALAAASGEVGARPGRTILGGHYSLGDYRRAMDGYRQNVTFLQGEWRVSASVTSSCLP